MLCSHALLFISSQSMFNDTTLVVYNQPWREYLHRRNCQTLQIWAWFSILLSALKTFYGNQLALWNLQWKRIIYIAIICKLCAQLYILYISKTCNKLCNYVNIHTFSFFFLESLLLNINLHITLYRPFVKDKALYRGTKLLLLDY